METILFIGSFVGLSLLIALRAFENKVGKVAFLERVFETGDTKINAFIDGAVLRYNYYKKVAQIFVFDFLPSLLYELLVKSKDYVAKRYYNAGNEFRGRRLLRNDGSVSSFLERLSEDAK
jgi:hypothetical protein